MRMRQFSKTENLKTDANRDPVKMFYETVNINIYKNERYRSSRKG